MSTDLEMAALKAAASSWAVVVAVAGILVFNWRRRLAMLLLISGSAKEDMTSRWLKNSTRRRNRQGFLVLMTTLVIVAVAAVSRDMDDSDVLAPLTCVPAHNCTRKPPQQRQQRLDACSKRTCPKHHHQHHRRCLMTAALSSGPRSLAGPRHALGGPPASSALGGSPSPQTQHIATLRLRPAVVALGTDAPSIPTVHPTFYPSVARVTSDGSWWPL